VVTMNIPKTPTSFSRLERVLLTAIMSVSGFTEGKLDVVVPSAPVIESNVIPSKSSSS
jgi:hypothetical protein